MDITIQIKVHKIFIIITINNCYAILFRCDEWKLIFQNISLKYLGIMRLPFKT